MAFVISRKVEFVVIVVKEDNMFETGTAVAVDGESVLEALDKMPTEVRYGEEQEKDEERAVAEENTTANLAKRCVVEAQRKESAEKICIRKAKKKTRAKGPEKGGQPRRAPWMLCVVIAAVVGSGAVTSSRTWSGVAFSGTAMPVVHVGVNVHERQEKLRVISEGDKKQIYRKALDEEAARVIDGMGKPFWLKPMWMAYKHSKELGGYPT
mmetsp:Transcript_36830/g.85708  ORF Transcript_36830/g.85708 Transcript_36830/m.85708 type:complete len:210 (-) Transcript_36830:74-703(-)